ncbi:hypothetical protein FIBSPDRAFT_1049779 [Athelia psychrophila]|uniref:G-protein coupled receptors family 2 profile 2 domain-containing protein n=1 Tax=Athelia psychrophila TaxID=1759441 RepID=A0A166BPI6_9AGAM|nr:hypothetical protein FIBSPDRAFT_1049779 [Fibularhizoctonia sp. CBS 109695]
MSSIMATPAADAFTVNCIETAILTFVTWDFLVCFTEEFSVAVICGCSRSILVYYTSRMGTLMLSVMRLVMLNAPMAQGCIIMWKIETTVLVLASSATSLLFLLRVRAVYEKSTPVTILFGVLWITIPLSCTLIGFVGNPSHTSSGLCSLSDIHLGAYATMAQWVKVVYDTSVFAAITLRVISYSKADCVQVPKLSPWQSWRGVGMPRIFRVLLHSALQFYFVTIGVTLMGACAILLPIASIDRVGLAQPALAFETIMACRVFRTLVLNSAKSREGRSHRDSIMLTTVFVLDAELT